LHPNSAYLIETVMMPGAAFGRLADAACHFGALSPSHSDETRNASEPIGLDNPIRLFNP